jgi:hypothetical protein
MLMSRTIALMQPYSFPYIGYFHLINAVDRFIAYDDVTFIKQGWINRNRILANGAPLLFSIPLSGAGSHTLIRNVGINNDTYASWRNKFYKTLGQCYGKAPMYEKVLPMIMDVLAGEHKRISTFAIHSIKAVCAYLAITTDIVETAIDYRNSHLKAEERVIDICCQENAHVYVNSPGGLELYSHENFKKKGIELVFIKSIDITYQQFGFNFVPSLSIIDVLMFNTIETIRQLINQYELV